MVQPVGYDLFYKDVFNLLSLENIVKRQKNSLFLKI